MSSDLPVNLDNVAACWHSRLQMISDQLQQLSFPPSRCRALSPHRRGTRPVHNWDRPSGHSLRGVSRRMRSRPGFSSGGDNINSLLMRRNPMPFAHMTLHILLDMSGFQTPSTYSVGKGNSVRLFRQHTITQQLMSISLPSGHPFIHSARLRTRTSSPAIVIDSSSGMGSMIVSVRSLEKNTLAYGSAMVLSDFSPVVQFSHFLLQKCTYHAREHQILRPYPRHHRCRSLDDPPVLLIQTVCPTISTTLLYSL
jgi:hypothetical protein